MATEQLTAEQQLATQGEALIEALGEYFIANRFRIAHEPADEDHAAVRMERFTRGTFPRFILDPSKIPPKLLTIDRLKSDLKFLMDLVSKNEAGFVDLVTSLNNPREFLKKAEKLGLTEPNLIKAGGGWAWIIIILAPLLLPGCPGPTSKSPPDCRVPHPHAPPGTREAKYFCAEAAGHGKWKGTQGHRTPSGDRW